MFFSLPHAIITQPCNCLLQQSQANEIKRVVAGYFQISSVLIFHQTLGFLSPQNGPAEPTFTHWVFLPQQRLVSWPQPAQKGWPENVWCGCFFQTAGMLTYLFQANHIWYHDLSLPYYVDIEWGMGEFGATSAKNSGQKNSNKKQVLPLLHGWVAEYSHHSDFLAMCFQLPNSPQCGLPIGCVATLLRKFLILPMMRGSKRTLKNLEATKSATMTCHPSWEVTFWCISSISPNQSLHSLHCANMSKCCQSYWVISFRPNATRPSNSGLQLNCSCSSRFLLQTLSKVAILLVGNEAMSLMTSNYMQRLCTNMYCNRIYSCNCIHTYT